MRNFTLATIQMEDNSPKPAIGLGGRYFPLAEIQPLLRDATVRTLLEDWATSFPMLNKFAEDLAAGQCPQARGIPAGEAQLLTPVMFPNKLIAVGANYSGHLKEMGLAPEKWTTMPFFLRPPTTSLVGPGETVLIPKSTQQFDWECELAIVIGKTLRHANREEARQGIAGYTIGLDLSCRDLLLTKDDLKVDLTRGKCQDTMAPCGPDIVPAQFVPDVDNLRIRLSVNGQPMMDASTDEMLYKVDEQLSVISQYITLEPGDIVFTGSPSGSAAVNGNCWLRPGDRIQAEIETIGTLNVSMRLH